MARMAGITIDCTNNGKPKSITFDYKMYGELLHKFFVKEDLDYPFSPYNKSEVEKLLSTKSDMKLGARKKVDLSNFWDE